MEVTMADDLLSAPEIELLFNQLSCTEDMPCLLPLPPPPPLPNWVDCPEVSQVIINNSVYSVFHNIIIICVSSVIIIMSLILMASIFKR